MPNQKILLSFLLILALCAFVGFQSPPLFPLTTIPQTGWINSGVMLAADGSLYFDGGDYLSTADNALFTYNDGQAASWDFMVKFSQMPANQDKFTLFSQGGLQGSWMKIEVYNDNGNPVLVIEGNYHPAYAYLNSFDVGEWHYLSIRKGTGATYSMYQNCNALSVTGDYPTLTNYTGNMYVGQFVNGGERLRGNISYLNFQRTSTPCTMPNSATATPSNTPTITPTSTATRTPTATFTPTPLILSCPVGYHHVPIDARSVRCEMD